MRLTRRVGKLAVVLMVLTWLCHLHPAGAHAQLPAGQKEQELGPDSHPQPGVPKGKLEQHRFTKSRIFPGTERDYWIYIPAQVRKERPACLMVFQDGEKYVRADGHWRVPVVFDNLIARKQMPVTIGVFVNPGVVPAATEDDQPRFNRSYEYDGMSDAYVRFLLDELLPEVGRRYRLSQDPDCRGIAGASSGAIAAFTAAWHRPDAFRRVFSAIGTYVGLRGGDEYPSMVRKHEPKPIRVFLQDGSGDLNRHGGNWWLANQTMLSALQYAGYEVAHAWGDGGHDHKHGGIVFPDALRFLWKDFPAKVRAGKGSIQPVVEVVDVATAWTPVPGKQTGVAGLAAGADGSVFFSIPGAGRIHRLDPGGKVTAFVQRSGGASALAAGPGGVLYAALPDKGQIVRFAPDGRMEPVANGLSPAHLVVSDAGTVWATDTARGEIWLVPRGGPPRKVADGLHGPSGLVLTPGHGWLYVAESGGRFLHSFQVQPDGGLAHGQRFCHLRLPADQLETGAAGMAMDSLGRPYVASALGIQFCDQPGKVNGILDHPGPGPLSQFTFGGPDGKTLFAVAGGRLFRRPAKVAGAHAAAPPSKPPVPRL